MFLDVNRLIIIKTSKNKPPTLSPARKPLLLAFLPFLSPNIKNKLMLNIKINKFVIVELTPIKLSKLVIKTKVIKNNV